MHRPARATRPLRVLLDVPVANWRKNPYVYALVSRAEPGIELVGFDRRTALLGSYDVVHSHWPEHRVTSHTGPRAALDRVWWVLWVVRLHLLRVPVVRTRHNRGPHEAVSRLDRVLLRGLESRTRAQVWLNERSREEGGGPATPTDVVIPHCELGPWIRKARVDVSAGRDRTTPHRLVSAGFLRRYKNIGEGIVAVAGCDEFTLHVVGPPSDPGYVAELQQLAQDAPGVTVRAERLRNKEFMEAVLASQAVLLPYEDLHNSGVLFLALGLGRPVILRDGPVARDLQDEYGREWIGTYAGELSPEGLRDAWCQVADAEGTPVGSPDRRWRPAARAHAALYRRVARRR